MSAKGFLVLCSLAVFVQIAFSSCAGRASYGLSSPIASGLDGCSCGGLGYNGLGYNNVGLGSGLGYSSGCGSGLALDVISTSGGSFPVSSSCSIAPTSLSISSDNIFEGSLYVTGELPFLSTAGLEGLLPSGGAGGVSYSCGNGVTAIESIGAGAGYGVGVGGYGAGAAIAPLSLAGGCNGGYGLGGAIGPVADIVAPPCGCYPPGIYY